MSCIKSVDYFGKSFKFNIDDGKFQTYLGGIISILLAVGVCCLTWYFGKDIYERRSPKFLKTEKLANFHPFVSIQKEKFKIGIKIEDELGNTLNDSRYIEYGYTYMHYKVDGSGVMKVKDKQILPGEKCSIRHVSNKTLYANHFYNYYCSEPNHEFGGSWQHNEIKIPSYWAKRCDSETEERLQIKCASEEEWKNYTRNKIFFFSFLIQKKLIDPSNDTNPISNSYTYKFKSVDLNHNKVNIYI